MPDDKVVTDEAGVQPDTEGKYPETVPWKQYVATKETIGGKLDTVRKEVETLKEAAKTAVNTEEHTKIKAELGEANIKLKENTEADKTRKDTKLSEMRKTLIDKGVSEDKVKDMSVEQLDGITGALDGYKPKPDMGSGGGGAGGLGEMSPKDRIVEADKRQREASK